MIYLDNAATTPLFPEVTEVIAETLANHYGNPSAIYKLGKEAKRRITTARVEIATLLGVNAKDLYFTSGATESNNWALHHLAYQSREMNQANHIVATAIEHPSVNDVLAYLQTQGFDVTYLEPNEHGDITVDQFQAASTQKTMGWVAIAVNNEVGSILPTADLARRAEALGYWFHVDAVQAIGHQWLDIASLPITALVGSAHKFNGPKGMGFLIYRPLNKVVALQPFIHGGGQESGKRSGTENVPYIVGMATAMRMTKNSEIERVKHDEELASYLYTSLNQRGIHYYRNGSKNPEHQVPYIHSLWFPEQLASQLLIKADLAGIAISAGSACSAGSIQPSRILKAYYPEQAQRWQESVRISFGYQTKKADIDALLNILK